MIDSKILQAFEPISLKEMGKVRLMNRTDTKFVTSFDKVIALLRLAAPHYRIQAIGQKRNMPYYTKYFDTPQADMYYQHERGKKTRQKIRIRRYEGSDVPPFIEVKSKNNKGRTHKERTGMTFGHQLSSYHDFLSRHSTYDPSLLIPHIENHFYRITLVNREMTERITIDTGLEFHNFITGKRAGFPNIGIIEWKRDGRTKDSPLEGMLNRLRIRPGGFSKYCIGMALTNPSLPQNLLKLKLKKIRQLNSSSYRPYNGNS